MNGNSFTILTLCSHIGAGEGIVPLEPREWNALASRLLEQGMQPSELLELSEQELKAQLSVDSSYAQRLLRLIDRGDSLSLTMSQYESRGISAVTRADPQYPAALRQKLRNQCPPIFYYAGDLRLLERQMVGYVGSRNISVADGAFAVQTVQKTVGRGFGVVSGGAKGIDTVAETEALRLGGTAVVYLADSMLRKLRLSATVRAVQDRKLLLLSVAKPDASFHAGIALMRNRFIYAQSHGTVVVRADLRKGGTWSGATDNLKHGWCPLFCREDPQYPGNAELIRMGATPINEAWDGNVAKPFAVDRPPEQLTLFDTAF